MSKWTLREQRTRQIRQGEKQTHKAALRASRYTRRHAWQFHGAGVEAAVRELTPVGMAMQEFVRGVKALIPVDTGQLRAAFMTPPDAVVGWRSPSGLLLCLKHPHREAAPVTADGLPGGGLCAVCSEGLGS